MTVFFQFGGNTIVEFEILINIPFLCSLYCFLFRKLYLMVWLFILYIIIVHIENIFVYITDKYTKAIALVTLKNFGGFFCSFHFFMSTICHNTVQQV